MKRDWNKFMLESNTIEGEPRVNPKDEWAVGYVINAGLTEVKDFLYVHENLTQHLKVPWGGVFRECDVRIGSTIPPDPRQIPRLMEDFCKSLPKLKSFEAHNAFEMIHPFQDFNGRMGRLLWLSKALSEGYNFEIPFLQKYYYQTLDRWASFQ